MSTALRRTYFTGGSDLPLRLVSALAGLVATALILLALGAAQNQALPAPSVQIDDLRDVVLPMEAPPPREKPKEMSPILTTNLLRLPPERTGSRVKLPVMPMLTDTVPAIAAVPRLDLPASEFKPATSDPQFEQQHIFNASEVDRRAVLLMRVQPFLTPEMYRGVGTVRITFILVVNRDGSVSNVRMVQPSGRHYLDKACLEALERWEFSPAMRKGKAVRQWSEQTFVIQVQGGSTPFETR